MQISELIQQATKFYEEGDYKSALKCAEKILKKDSKNADALVIKGNVFYQKHQIDDSLKAYLSAIETDSHHKIALINTANTYFELKDYEQSYHYIEQALKTDSYDKTALTIWGNSALELEKYDEGKEAFLRILEQDSSDAWAYNSLSRIFQKTEDNRRALAYGWKAVEVSGGNKDHHINFGYLLYEIGGNLTLKYATEWLKKYGQDSVVNHMGNAILHNTKITRAEGEYVEEIFDAFADDFEDVLKGLNYRAPELISNEIKQLFEKQKISKMSILDAGCGTGFCGEFLKKYARFKGLYGVDISEKMIKKAASKKVYDKLIKADLEKFFDENKKKFDLIVSADVFTYLGDLKKIIEGCFKSLSKNGRILFTVSENDIDDSDYYLHPSGRFLHHQKYIEKLLQNSGFEIIKISKEMLRQEGGKDVKGYVVNAIKKT